MRSSRITLTAAVLGSLALPLLSAPTASAAVPSGATVTRPCEQPGPWNVHASAVTIRAKASAKATAVGILYPSHDFTAHPAAGNWVAVTDHSTGVSGFVSGTYVYRGTRICLD
ncbi:SH3 domain-containing protein [Streptomyces paromomycinus]|uniref:SH3 domain-containing protein n=1 Tax=Streptomyces paromomycinus TaxID=92743 RepID=A0A401VXS9_STREY|nr:SH3 domain-containing protein [Streptomyces paromomycinus]GCD41841.1 hypothetical protein GKJPGBOP_01498 [Streptomyces paromomycinus]